MFLLSECVIDDSVTLDREALQEAFLDESDDDDLLDDSKLLNMNEEEGVIFVSRNCM